MGASELLFDDLWEEAKSLKSQPASKILEDLFKKQPLFQKEFEKIKKCFSGESPERVRKGVLFGADLFLTEK
jgi:hypothetical protein